MFINWTYIAYNLVPFYAHFFKFYRPTQKLHTLNFLKNHKVYDQELFSNFIDQISKQLL